MAIEEELEWSLDLEHDLAAEEPQRQLPRNVAILARLASSVRKPPLGGCNLGRRSQS
jgi:hypothetical protein